MAAANESQGLKIAVAVFVSLTVILAVSTYFMYSSYSQANARFEDQRTKASDAQRTASKALSDSQELRSKAGFGNIEDAETLKATIKKHEDKLTNDLNAIVAEVKKATAAYKEAGGTDTKINDLEQAAEDLVNSYRDEPNKTFSSSIDRLRELLRTQADLTTAYAIDNINLRGNLVAMNSVNDAKVQAQTDAATKAKTDLEAEHNTHEQTRQELLSKVDKLQTDLTNVSTELENLKTRSQQMRDDYEKKVGDFRNQLTYYKDLTEKKETVVDNPDGAITDIDYTTNEVRTTVTRRMGARAQMEFTVFDKREPLPNNHPKATIRLISVDDRGSRGKILPQVRTGTSLQSSADIPEPIHLGDYIYSAAWSPNAPERFALIGKIDMNRDGRDDRNDLKRMIQAAGGIVEYDLPPPDAGRESGRLTSLSKYYVVDERLPLSAAGRSRTAGATPAEVEFYKKQSESIREARSLGIKPMPIDRLLIYLGYNPNMSVTGRVESLDVGASADLLRSRARGSSGTPATPPAAPGGNEEKKDEEKPEEAAAPK